MACGQSYRRNKIWNYIFLCIVAILDMLFSYLELSSYFLKPLIFLMQACIMWNHCRFVARIYFGKTVGRIFNILPVDKVIDEIKFEIIYSCVLPPYWIYFFVIKTINWKEFLYKIVDFSLKTFEDFFDLFFKNDF